MEKTVIRGDKLCMRYEGNGVAVDALRDVSFALEEREFIVVLGPSGSGKSTLLNVIGGMDQPTAGGLWYQDKLLTGCTSDQLAGYRRHVVGFVFQFFNLIPSLTAWENVELAATLVKNPMDTGEALSLVGLSGRERHFPSQLSGGEQQRVSVARAVVKRPRLLLCDEPTGALDSVNSVGIVKLLLDVRESIGCPVITITHNPEMAKVADRVFHMKDGRIVEITEHAQPCRAEELDW